MAEAITESFEDVLDDLFTRFLMNLPAEEVTSPGRLGFQLEQAFWFYDDFYRAENRSLPKFNLKTFAITLLGRYPEWTEAHGVDAEKVVTEFLKYKAQVPTCGAIILNPGLNKVLMVRGYQASSSWGFPKGKIAKDESPEECAVREVAEEIGFDIGPYLRSEDYIQLEGGPHSIRLYIIGGVEENVAQFQTRTRKEIGAVGWFNVSDLTNASMASKFYNVTPFVGRLKAWIKRVRRGAEPPKQKVVNMQELQAGKKKKKQAKEKEMEAAAVTKTILQKPMAVEIVTAIPLIFDRRLIEAAFDRAWNKT